MREKIMAMEAGNVLDQLIAEGVMGWKERIDFDIVDGFVARYVPNTMEVKEFKPSTDISAAWEVAETFPRINVYCHQELTKGNYEVCFIQNDFEHKLTSSCESLSEAICKAALLAMIEP